MAAYDTYDYPSYWLNRDYEHASEVWALGNLLGSIKKIEKIIDIGCGFGRLTPSYIYRAKKVTLFDPSQNLLDEARKRLKLGRKVSFIQGTVEDMNQKFNRSEFDVAIMVRVMHHLTDPEHAIKTISRIVKPGGYLILEFANKIHGKAIFSNFAKGNFTFPIDIFPSDRKSHKNRQAIPFLNYHPDVIYDALKKSGFKIVKRRSVSNIRSSMLKKHLSIPILLEMEKVLQQLFASFPFGPSIFVLAKKKKLQSHNS